MTMRFVFHLLLTLLSFSASFVLPNIQASTDKSFTTVSSKLFAATPHHITNHALVTITTSGDVNGPNYNFNLFDKNLAEFNSKRGQHFFQTDKRLTFPNLHKATKDSYVYHFGPFSFAIDKKTLHVLSAWGPNLDLQRVYVSGANSVFENTRLKQSVSLQCDTLCRYITNFKKDAESVIDKSGFSDLHASGFVLAGKAKQKVGDNQTGKSLSISLRNKRLNETISNTPKLIKNCGFANVSNLEELISECRNRDGNSELNDTYSTLQNFSRKSAFCAGLQSYYLIQDWASCPSDLSIREALSEGTGKQIWYAYISKSTSTEPQPGDFNSSEVTVAGCDKNASWGEDGPTNEDDVCVDSVQGPTIRVYSKRNPKRIISSAIKTAIRWGFLRQKHVVSISWRKSCSTIKCQNASYSSYQFVCRVTLVLKGLLFR